MGPSDNGRPRHHEVQLVMPTASREMLLLTADEFYDVCRAFRPEMTREEFSLKWSEFQKLKVEYNRQKTLQ